MTEYAFTVFTPTFNRAHTLPRVYESLKAQSFRDFEWLIVDDGSTDGTAVLVRQWQEEAGFPIRYIWQENAGKHVAVNHGVQEAQGELFLIIDSDNACLPTALERFKFHWDSIPIQQKLRFSAVTSLAQDPDGHIVGTRFPLDPTDSNSLEIRLKHGVKGEKWGFHRTQVLRRFPYPVFEGETTVPDGLVWNRIALRYKTRYVNEALEVYFTTRDSRGSSPLSRIEGPQGARLYYEEFVNLDYPIPEPTLLRNYANYVRYSMHGRIGLVTQRRRIRSSIRWLLAFPLGLLLFVRDWWFWKRGRHAP